MKPFKIPSIVGRKSVSTHRDEIVQPQAKRRCISPSSTVDQQSASAVLGTSLDTQARKPLLSTSLPRRTPLEPIISANGSTPAKPQSDGGQTHYFNALWRRPTTKKNKTWDGDGIVTCSNGSVILEDTSGKILGRASYNSQLSVGSQLNVAGREVEIESELSKQDALSGRRFLGKSQAKQRPEPAVRTAGSVSNSHMTAVVGPSSTKASQVVVVKPRNTDFKLPLASANTSSSTRDGKVPTPRHDPAAPDALVMKRPKSAPKGKHVVDVVVDPLLTRHLREHQRAGVAFLYECVMGMKDYAGEGAVLADEMGLGKTLQTIALIWTLLKQSPIFEDQPVIKKALIVCPVTLIKNWRKEFRKWLGNERIGVLVADEKHTRITDFTLGKAYSVMIIGYERLRSVKEELQKGDGVDIVIADEGHRLKTAKNKSADAIKSLATERRIILSGTPIQNDLEEFYTMVDFVNPNLLGKYSVFKREFEIPILKSQQPGASRRELEKGEARSEELASITSMFILRRTADILSEYLPMKTEYVVFCRPTTTQATVYQSIIRSPIYSAALGSSGLALELINVLKKVCNSPSLLLSKGDKAEEVTNSAVFDYVPAHLLKSPGSSGKLQVLDSLLHKIRTTTNDKVVLVSNYTSTLDILGRLLASLEYGYLRLDGSTPASKRQDLVDRFNRSNANNFFVFLLSAKAGGTGLNLIGANRLVLFDIDWNPATDLQAMARVHRDGQKKPCYIYRLLTKGALDEKIFQRQVSKTGLADSIVDGKSSASSFTKDELRDLFTLEQTDDCQTHRLLACRCKGDGVPPVPLQTRESLAAVDANEKRACVDEIELVHLEDKPALSVSNINDSFTPSSSVNMEAQEEELRRRTKTFEDSGGRVKMLSLMQYAHIDTTTFKCARSAIECDPEEPEQSLEVDVIEDVIGDAALQSVMHEDGGRVSFVFVKKSS